MSAMSGRCLILASFVSLGLIYLASVTEAQPFMDCCYSYTKKPLRLKVIQNFTIQSSRDVCDMDAIIFHTKTKKFNVCANPEDPWVKSILEALRKRAKKLSKGKQISRKNKKTGSRKQD